MMSYTHPILQGFAAPAFVETAEKRRRAVQRTLHGTFGDRLRLDPVWARIAGDRPLGTDRWIPKLYVCVGSRSYWSVVEEIARCRELTALCDGFKFYNISLRPARSRALYRRPDKIVFYAPVAQMPALLQRLAPIVEGHAHHGLRHTGTPAQYGLPAVAGIRVGLDPAFLPNGPSWRLYRAAVLYWLTLNRRHVSATFGPARDWLPRMNLDLDSEGPLSLAPPGRHRAFVRARWADIFDGDG